MKDLKTKAEPQFKCNHCDKPYIKKGALTNHMSKVHLLVKSPIKKSFMDISTNSDNNEAAPIKSKYKCVHCDKSYAIKKALLGHVRKSHKKKEETIIEIEEGDEFGLDCESTFFTKYAQQKDKEEEADELEAILGMTSQIDFDSSILTHVETEPKSPNVIKVNLITGKKKKLKKSNTKTQSPSAPLPQNS